MSRYDHTPTDALALKARVTAAIANNPRISAGDLHKLTGLPLGKAIASVEARKAVV